MSRIGKSINLEDNSRYDLLVYDFPEGYPTGAISLGFGDTPRRITGITKVSQVFLKTLLTYAGTDVVNASRGTQFPSFTGTRNVQTSTLSGVSSEIRNAIEVAETQAKAILNIASEGNDSQLASVQILGISSLQDSTDVQVQLITKAGEEASIALPFTSLGLEINS